MQASQFVSRPRSRVYTGLITAERVRIAAIVFSQRFFEKQLDNEVRGGVL